MTATKLSKPVAKVLPRDAREALVAAAKARPAERAKAVQAAADRAKRLYPQFFQSEGATR